MNVMTVVIDELGRRQTKAELIERRKLNDLEMAREAKPR